MIHHRSHGPMFAEIAARRQDLENQCGHLARLRKQSHPHAEASALRVDEALRMALADVHLVLTSPKVAGHVKRDILLQVVERVVCHKEGAGIVFIPGLFAPMEGTGQVGMNRDRQSSIPPALSAEFMTAYAPTGPAGP